MKDLPHKVITSKKVFGSAKQWCEERLGPRWEATGYKQGRWCVFWSGIYSKNPGTYEWFFENDKDAVLFALRWA